MIPLLGVTQDESLLLLQHCKWDQEKLVDEYFARPDKVCVRVYGYGARPDLYCMYVQLHVYVFLC
ncbi:hypothetical protein EON64_08450 [archaeon]|nr:MAG: hypothetical protein EON64_08450 [archaeon]